MVAAFDTDQLGQALLAIFIAVGWAAQQYRARKRAEEVKRKAEETAAAVAMQATIAAEGVAAQVDAARAEQQRALDQITVLVNGRLDDLIAQLDRALQRNEQLEGKLGIAPGADIPSSQILTQPTEPTEPETDKPPAGE